MHIKRAAVFAVIALAIGAVLAPTAMALTSDPVVNSSSDISDGATVNFEDASSDTNSTLIIETNNGDTIESAELTIEVPDRDITAYSADADSDDYSVDTEVDTTNDGSADSDVHTWQVSHDEFANVPLQYNESQDLEFNATVTSGAGGEGHVNGTMTLQNQGNMSTHVLDSTAIDDDSVGPEVSVEEASEGYFFGIGAEDVDTYEIEDTSTVAGTNGTVHLRLADADAADAFESESMVSKFWGDDELPASQARVFTLTGAYDDSVSALFFDASDSDLVSGNDTYAVYDADSDLVRYEVGGDYSEGDEMDLHVANQPPNVNFDTSVFDAAYVEGLGFWDLRSALGMDALDFADIPFAGE